MTEAEWLACSNPQQMLREFPGEISERKRRLFGCAACRRIGSLMDDPRCREAVEASEQFADGLISERQLDLFSAAAEEAYEEAVEATDDLQANVAHAASYSSSPSLSVNVLASVISAIIPASYLGSEEEWLAQANILRDIFGNPFRPVAFDPAWLTSDVLALARGIDNERAFDRMPILADALQDAGCGCEGILTHCRDANTTHVRGCWVVDLVLGKE